MRLHGTVLWFSDHKGYGYLTADDGTPVYVHHAQIEGDGFRTLLTGSRVTFDLGDDGRGPAAQSVRVADVDDPPIEAHQSPA